MSGGISDYALERALREAKPARRRKSGKGDRGNVSSELQNARVDEKIRELLALGLDFELVTQHLLQWNQEQASPMAVGMLKKRLFFSSSKPNN